MEPMWLDHDLLMIPGPSEPYPEAVAMLSRPVLPHYGRRWIGIYTDTCEKLKKLFGTRDEVILLPAPGAAAMELAVANVLEPGDRAIVVHDGFFADIFRQLVEIYEGKPILVKEKYGRAVKPGMIAETLEDNVGVKAIFLVHSDTSTGVKHDVEAVGRIAEEYDLIYIVDAVSSIGGMELKVDEWKIDMCLGYASKALGGINGVVPIAVKDRVWDYVKNRRSQVRARFFDLNLWRKSIDEWSSWGQPHPTSMPTPIIIALRRAVELAFEEGLEKRFRRHTASKTAIRRALESLGLELLVRDDEDASDTLTTVILPGEVDARRLISLVSKRFNILLGSLILIGLNGLRIAHMGQTASPHYLLPTFYALEHTLNEMGRKVRMEESLMVLAETLQKLLK